MSSQDFFSTSGQDFFEQKRLGKGFGGKEAPGEAGRETVSCRVFVRLEATILLKTRE
jgi:hypothetical protein